MSSFSQRPGWSDKPGFWDPYSVAKTCVQALMPYVFPNRRPLAIRQCQKVKSVNMDPCAGILLYLEPLEEDPELEKAVSHYITYPCQQRLYLAIKLNGKAPLQFLLSYLRQRGAFMKWPISESTKSSITTSRHIVTWATKHIRMLPELDFCAIAVIGRYLNYLNHVAGGHDMFFMGDTLAKLWGPLFAEIVVAKNYKTTLTEEVRIHQVVKMFKSMLEGVPWHQMRPTEDMNRSLYPNNKFDFYHRYSDMADIVVEQTTLPTKFSDNMCQKSLETLLEKGVKHYELQPTQAEVSVPTPIKSLYCCQKFPPDNCCQSFSSHTPGDAYI